MADEDILGILSPELDEGDLASLVGGPSTAGPQSSPKKSSAAPKAASPGKSAAGRGRAAAVGRGAGRGRSGPQKKAKKVCRGCGKSFPAELFSMNCTFCPEDEATLKRLRRLAVAQNRLE
eukprot:800191-Lingulodinium_polyedra.AAC.1